VNANEIAKWVLGLGTALQFSLFVIPALIHIIKDGASLPPRHRLSMHAWLVVFWALNTVVFWLSMQSATGKGLLEKLGGWVVAAQICVMLGAIPLVARPNWNSPTVPVTGNALRWCLALVLFIAANVLALYHSWHEFPNWQKAIVWTLMDFGAMAFYAFILGRISAPSALAPPGMFFLWPWVVGPLIVLTIVDIVLLRK